MVGEGIQNYVDMAAGLTKASRAKATKAAKSLLAATGLEEAAADAGDRVSRLTEEILAASRANRELMGKLVAAEVDKAAARLGFVRADELDELRRELSEVRMRMAHASVHPDEPPAPPEPLSEPDDAPVIQPITEPSVAPDAGSGAALRSAAKKTATKKAAAKKSAAKNVAAKKVATAQKSPAARKTAVTKKTAAAKKTAAPATSVTDAGADT